MVRWVREAYRCHQRIVLGNARNKNERTLSTTKTVNEQQDSTPRFWELLTCLALGSTVVVASQQSHTSQQQPILASSTKLTTTIHPLSKLSLRLTEPTAPQIKILTDKHVDSKSNAGGRRVYDISVRAIKGGRLTMEDEYFVANGGRFAAVFDGHGGGGVSQFLKAHLYEFHQQGLQRWQEQEAHPAPSIAAQVQALRMAFDEIETNVLEDDRFHYQGSTAVAVVLHESAEGLRTLLSANVGDSRAILSRDGRAIDLTRDHKPNEEREKARILGMGEEIEWDALAKVHRVRNLSLSRAIGDRYAKPVVSGQVEINHYPVNEEKDEFILLASDGLWDVMTSQEVVSYVHRRMEKELESGNVAKDDLDSYKMVLRRNMANFVAREAFRRGSGDNICVLMVWLNDGAASAS